MASSPAMHVVAGAWNDRFASSRQVLSCRLRRRLEIDPYRRHVLDRADVAEGFAVAIAIDWPQNSPLIHGFAEFRGGVVDSGLPARSA